MRISGDSVIEACMHEQLRRRKLRETIRSSTSIRLYVLAMCLATAGLSGCTRKYFEWTEQVQLSDGSSVEVERSIRYGKVLRELGGPTSAWISEAKVTIVDRGKRLPAWSHAMEPFILDRDKTTGRWRLVANAMEYCEYSSRFGSPIPTFPTFELSNDGWRYVGTPEAVIDQAANLLVGVPTKNRSQLTAREVAVLNERRLPTSAWRTVNRQHAQFCADQEKLEKKTN